MITEKQSVNKSGLLRRHADGFITLQGGEIEYEGENEKYHETASVQHSAVCYLFCHIYSAGKFRAVPGRFPCRSRCICPGTSLLRDGNDQDRPKQYPPHLLPRNAEQTETEKRGVITAM